MLNKIKSKFFYAFIFECISEKVKLNIIKYNKSLQKSINIKLLNYKLLSGKYIIKESNEIWKLYNAFNDILIFEGNYLNGKGKEYYSNGNLLCEGEYLNGKRHGKTIFYYYEGNKHFECEKSNGKRIGKFKEYYLDGKLLSEGEYLNNKKWNLKKYDINGNIINEIKDGKGYFNIHDEFNGFFSNLNL